MAPNLRRLCAFAVLPGVLGLLALAQAGIPAPKGVVVTVGEVVAEILAIIGLLGARPTPAYRPIKLALLAFFALLAVGDTSWAIAFFTLHLPATSPAVVLLTRASYNLAFALACLVPLLAARGHLRALFSPLLPVSLAIFLPIAARFLIVPVVAKVQDEPFSLIGVQMIDIVALLALAIVSFLILVQSQSSSWTLYCAATLVLVLGDWSTQIADSGGKTPAYDAYEFFWAAGVFACATAVLSSDLLRERLVLPRRLVTPLSLIKVAMLFAAYALVLMACLWTFSDSPGVVRIMAAALAVITLATAFASQAIVELGVRTGRLAPLDLADDGPILVSAVSAGRAGPARPRRPVEPMSWDKPAAYAFGVVFIVTLLVLAIKFPDPTPFQYFVFRTILALAAGGIASIMAGFIQVHYRGFIRAGGALAVFTVVYFFTPAALIAEAWRTANIAPSPPAADQLTREHLRTR